MIQAHWKLWGSYSTIMVMDSIKRPGSLADKRIFRRSYGEVEQNAVLEILSYTSQLREVCYLCGEVATGGI